MYDFSFYEFFKTLRYSIYCIDILTVIKDARPERTVLRCEHTHHSFYNWYSSNCTCMMFFLYIYIYILLLLFFWGGGGTNTPRIVQSSFQLIQEKEEWVFKAPRKWGHPMHTHSLND
jgi:hypothetical protein